jgi:hypothetical protein
MFSLEDTVAELRRKAAALTADIESRAVERADLLNEVEHLMKERDEIAHDHQNVNRQLHELQQALQMKQVGFCAAAVCCCSPTHVPRATLRQYRDDAKISNSSWNC